MSDMVNNVQHYSQAAGTLEPIDVINNGPFDLGNAIKYLCRAGHKDDESQDILKAYRYIIEAINSYRHDPSPYDYWCQHNLVYLKKLKPFKDVNSTDAKSLIFELTATIDKRLVELGLQND